MRQRESQFQSALKRHRAGDAEGAERIYRAILARSPDHAGAWHLLGLVHFARGEFELAREHIERALSLCSTKAVYHNNHGAVLRELGLTIDAKRACERALEIHPGYADARSNLGLCLRDLGEAGAAIDQFTAALRIKPDHVDALGHLARLCRDVGRHEEAVRNFRRALKHAPDRFENWASLGALLMVRRCPVEAAEAFRRAVQLRPDDARAQLALATALADAGDLSRYTHLGTTGTSESVRLVAGDITDQTGIPGQSNPDPTSFFRFHAIVRLGYDFNGDSFMDYRYFDPSYGAGYAAWAYQCSYLYTEAESDSVRSQKSSLPSGDAIDSE